MRQTKVDPVDYARAIVHDCLARDFGVMSAAEAAHESAAVPLSPEGVLWSAPSIALWIVALVPSVAIVVWLLTR
jgi:hypothetical protein